MPSIVGKPKSKVQFTDSKSKRLPSVSSSLKAIEATQGIKGAAYNAVANANFNLSLGGSKIPPIVNTGPEPNISSDLQPTLYANGIYDRIDIKWYDKFSRFGIIDPYNAVTGSREYLFFTKPDLHITSPGGKSINSELAGSPYFLELKERYSNVIGQLQKSSGYSSSNPFMAVLSNAVKNTLELPSISSDTIDTPSNIYGTSYSYRGSGYNSDEKVQFSLEFEDTKYLEIYQLFKAYENYERLKKIGMVTPPNIDNAPMVNGICMDYYTRTKRLHDQFAIYKIIVEDDGETIIYYAKLWGAFPKSVPRDSFSDMKTEGGLTYAVEFEAAFLDDLDPVILTDFNDLTYNYIKSTKDLPVFNFSKGIVDGRWATMPVIVRANRPTNWNGPSDMKYSYKLKWRI